MPDQSEVIMGQMEETRKDLADKIETLEKKVAGTVETVTETVQTVESTVENVKDSIQETVESVTDKVQNTVQAVEETVGSTVERVKSFFDISHHVQEYPWLMMGGSVVAGFVGGWLLTPRRAHTEEAPAPPSAAQYSAPSYTPPPQSAPAPPTREPEPAEEGWLGKLAERFAPEVGRLKGLALGTLFGVARDMVGRVLPDAVKEQVTDVINMFTTDVGGEVIQQPLLGPGEEESRDEGRRANQS